MQKHNQISQKLSIVIGKSIRTNSSSEKISLLLKEYFAIIWNIISLHEVGRFWKKCAQSQRPHITQQLYLFQEDNDGLADWRSRLRMFLRKFKTVANFLNQSGEGDGKVVTHGCEAGHAAVIIGQLKVGGRVLEEGTDQLQGRHSDVIVRVGQQVKYWQAIRTVGTSACKWREAVFKALNLWLDQRTNFKTYVLHLRQNLVEWKLPNFKLSPFFGIF